MLNSIIPFSHIITGVRLGVRVNANIL